MQIHKSKYKSYIYTVKILKDPVFAVSRDYDPFFRRLTKYVHVKYKVCELDSNSVLHYHGIFTARKNFYLKRLCLHNFHLHIRELQCQEQWLRYIHKDCIKTMSNLFS